MRTFTLQRTEDVSSTSGIGVVGEGIEFSDGTCAIRWLSKMPSTGIYDSVINMIKVHGHGGKTAAVFEDGSKVV